MGITPDHPKANHPRYIIERAIAYTPGKSAQQELDEALAPLTKEVAESIRSAVTTLTTQAMASNNNNDVLAPARLQQTTIAAAMEPETPYKTPSKAGSRGSGQHDDDDDSRKRPAEVAAITPTPTAKKKQKKDCRTGSMALMSRTSYQKNLCDKDKLKLFLQMGDEVAKAGGMAKSFINKDRQFVTRFVIPINRCFWVCCKGDTTEFLKGMTPFSHSDVEKKYGGGCVHKHGKEEGAGVWKGRGNV